MPKSKKKKEEKEKMVDSRMRKKRFRDVRLFFFFFFLTTWPSIVTPAGLCNRSTTTKKTTRPVAQSSGNYYFFKFFSNEESTYVPTRLFITIKPPPSRLLSWLGGISSFLLSKSTASNRSGDLFRVGFGYLFACAIEQRKKLGNRPKMNWAKRISYVVE